MPLCFQSVPLLTQVPGVSRISDQRTHQDTTHLHDKIPEHYFAVSKHQIVLSPWLLRLVLID